MKIAMLGHKTIPSNEGGIEVVVGELATRMTALHHSVTCYNRKGHEKKHESGTIENGYYKGVRLVEVFTINKRGLAAMTSSIIGSLQVTFGDYDVVHFHAEGPALLCWLPRVFGKRVIVTIHGLDYQRAKWSKLASLYIWLGEISAVKFSHEIIVLSHNTQKYFADKYKRKTVFIPNAVEEKEQREADLITQHYGLEKDNYILFLGRLVPEKRPDLLIKAFRHVNTEKKLVIAGTSSDTDDYMDSLQRLAGDDKRILFTGFVDGRCKEELYSNAYCYVLPSDLEGMAISMLEAMAYGNCCLTSDIPECSEVLGEHGIYFPKGDGKALRDQIQNLCDHPETVRHYRDGAQKYICDRYHWDDVVEKTLKLYQKN